MRDMIYTCIVCPQGCPVRVGAMDNGELCITGNQCLWGREYAEHEHLDPQRTITSVVRIHGAKRRCLPVIGTAEVPKGKLKECLSEIYKIQVNAPVKAGDIIIKNIGNLGIDIVAARSMRKIMQL